MDLSGLAMTPELEFSDAKLKDGFMDVMLSLNQVNFEGKKSGYQYTMRKTLISHMAKNPDSKISFYSTDGILIKKDCKVEDLKTLNKGIYIIKSGNSAF